jgi:hypothetical protein
VAVAALPVVSKSKPVTAFGSPLSIQIGVFVSPLSTVPNLAATLAFFAESARP